MRRAVALAVLLCAPAAVAQDLSGRALLSFQGYDFGTVEESGLRQSYDLKLDRAFTGTTRLRLFFRADDFRGSSELLRGSLREESESREYQPSGEFIVNADTLRLILRGDYIDTRAKTGTYETQRTTERTFALLNWEPIGLPSLMVLAQRNAAKDRLARAEPTDDTAAATLQYPWRGFSSSVEGRYVRSADPGVGYDRTMTTVAANAGFAHIAKSGRFSVSADAGAQRATIDERATAGQPVLIPVPVPMARASFSVDDTPSDNRDHPLSPFPGLKDGDVNTSVGLSLGPDGASFLNLAGDIGRNERVDEIRIVVRDAAGNPLRTGGGPVTWDAYVSDDGQLWRPMADVTSSFDATRSLYSVTFALTTARWFKVVNFGVNAEASFITELQFLYHARVVPGAGRNGEQGSYNAALSVNYRPAKNLTLAYGGAYSALRQEYETFAPVETASIDHMLALDYDFARDWSARGQVSLRDVDAYNQVAERAETYLAALDYSPTRRLLLTLENSRQTQTLLGVPNTIETIALRANGQPLRALTITLDAGFQTQTVDGLSGSAERKFVNLLTSARLTRTTRLQLTGTLQRATSDSTDPASLLLGAVRDDRAYAELIWQPGRPLLVSTRIGYVSSEVLSGFTQRVRLEWYPFGGGTVSLAATYDEDIDPLVDRRARRMVFSPRWAMNRFVTFDVNYTAVSSTFRDRTDEQKTLFATVTVTR